MGSSVRMAQARCNGRCKKTKTCDDGGSPAHRFLINGLAVRELCFYTCHTLSRVCIVDVNLDKTIQIGNAVGDAWKDS